MTEDLEPLFKEAVLAGDAGALRELARRRPEVRTLVDEPLFYFDAPAIVQKARQREIVEALLELGADINRKSDWWAGGFSALHHLAKGDDSDTAAFLIERGAEVDVQSAAGLAMMDRLESLLAADPDLVNDKGPDGQSPLHFAREAEVIDFLLERGADIDQRDVDHESTPAQWAVGDEAKCRHLIERGASIDVFMAAAIGDPALIDRALDEDPYAIEARIQDGTYSPVPVAPGSHIYAYELHDNFSALQVADSRGNEAAWKHLWSKSGPRERLLGACWRGDEVGAAELLHTHPNLLATLRPRDREQLGDAAWHNRGDAVRAMIEVGFDAEHRGKNDGATPLHRAAFHGFIDAVRPLLELDGSPPLAVKNEYGATPLGVAVYGSVHSWRDDGDHVATVKALIGAGADVDPGWLSCGNAAVDAVLRDHLEKA